MTNPALGSNPVFADPVKRRGANADPATLESMYAAPSATPVQTGRMTYDDVIIKTGGLLALLVAVAAVSWQLTSTMPSLFLVGLGVGFVLGLVNAFKRKPSPALITAYTVAEGVFLGGLSAWLDAAYPGIALQALIATVVTFAVTLVLFTSGKVRVTAKSAKIFMVALVSYGLFSLVNLGLMLFNVTDDPWGLRGQEIGGMPLGVIVGALAVILAAYSLIMDFDMIKRGVESGAARIHSWAAAFGLIVTLVWLYTEFLRIFALLSGRD